MPFAENFVWDVIEPEKMIRPLEANYVVELLEPEETTASGIFLPSSIKSNWTSGIIRAVGPGYAIPDTDGCRSTMWGEEGDEVVFLQHHLRLFGDRIGCVKDEYLIALVQGDGALQPMNDWVAVDVQCHGDQYKVDNRETGLIIPSAYHPRSNTGRITGYGPGKLRFDGYYYGTRKSVPGIMGMYSGLLSNLQVHWGDDATCLELGRESVESVFVRAGDILIWEGADYCA